MSVRAVRVQPRPDPTGTGAERRVSDRKAVALDATSRPLDGQDTIWWGATVRDLSSSGIGLALCYPFPPGTFLAIDLHNASGGNRTLLTKVVHTRDQADGTWHLGCEFVKQLTDSDVELMI